MKANEAPEKLYFGEKDETGLKAYSRRESEGDIEYTRTEAIVKKIEDWLKENAGDYVVHHWNETMLDTTSLIEDIKEYLKGE